MGTDTMRDRSGAARPRPPGRQPERAAKTRGPRSTGRGRYVLAAVVLTAVCGVGGYLSYNWWLSGTGPGDRDAAARGQAQAGADDGQAAQPADHAVTSLRLSEQARKNIGLRLLTVELGDFDRTVSIPATVVERPGRTLIRVSATMTGVIERIYRIPGEAVTPGRKLFDLRPTHEDLVTRQGEFLQTLEQLDVIRREVDRLREVTSSGAIAGKRLLEQQYQQQKTEALLRAQREALILHGLSKLQVDGIDSTRKLLSQVTILAPGPAEGPQSGTPEPQTPEPQNPEPQNPEPQNPEPQSESTGPYLQVSNVAVEQGQQVTAGEALCTLTDHAELYIEGRAFEEDAESLSLAASRGTEITAVVQGDGKGPHSVTGLKILYVEGRIELQSRALPFYVRLPNHIVRNQLVRNDRTAEGHRFIDFRYRPGQRVELLVPVERWQDRIVLPMEAAVNDGAEWFVFQQNGDHFDRLPVHVEHRDQAGRQVVIENDGSLYPGDVVAASGAFRMNQELKNQAGGGVDPHAGHSH